MFLINLATGLDLVGAALFFAAGFMMVLEARR